MAIRLKHVAHYVPKRVVSNQEIIDHKSLKIKDEWIKKRIGIHERRWASEDQSASDLAHSAVLKLGLNELQGSLWLSTISQDYFTPSTSSILKSKLGFKNEYPAFDINAACAGQLFALEAAYHRLLMTEETESLVVATEVRSRYLNPDDRRTVFLFADGAVAFHLIKDDSADSIGIEWIINKTIPSDSLEILVPGGGSVSPYRGRDNDALAFIKMNDGPKIVNLTTQTLLDNINEILYKKNYTLKDFDFFIFHQGNSHIIHTVLDHLGIPKEKTFINFDHFGNTSSASMGIAFSEAFEKGLIKKGQRILMMAMGAGYHLGLASIVWG